MECDGRVSSELHLHSSTAAVDLIPGILAAGVQVMMFAGAEDLICNYKGIERMLDHMHWGGVTGMGNSTREGWSLNGTKVGEWQEARNMTYVKVREVFLGRRSGEAERRSGSGRRGSHGADCWC